MLPERAIFSLSAIPKVVETVFKRAIDSAKVSDGTKQMAYTPGIGTVLCNAITLWNVERTNEPTIQCLQDCVKAFNSVRQDTVINEAQRKFGLGRLFSTWFNQRAYSYNGKVRGHDHNSGAQPGTLFGVEAFLLFIATCVALTGLNKGLLWPSLFADDASPLVTLSYIISGSFQRDLIRAVEWSKKQAVKFHKTGKKAPKFLAFLKHGQQYPNEFDNIWLDDVLFKNVEETVQLGTGIRTKSRDQKKKPSKEINKYGYQILWKFL
jgi:hypothetical protein